MSVNFKLFTFVHFRVQIRHSATGALAQYKVEEVDSQVCNDLNPLIGQVPGRVLPYLGMVGRFHGDDLRFGDFQSECVPIFYLNTI